MLMFKGSLSPGTRVGDVEELWGYWPTMKLALPYVLVLYPPLAAYYYYSTAILFLAKMSLCDIPYSVISPLIPFIR